MVFLEALHRDRKAYALSYTLWKDAIEKRGYRSTHLPTLGVEAKMLHIENISYMVSITRLTATITAKINLQFCVVRKHTQIIGTDIQITEIENE